MLMARRRTRVYEPVGRPGIPVDYQGDDTIDPTKNVLDLVRALEATLEQLRTADAKRLDDLRNADNKRQDDLRESDTKRLSELASQKDRYDRQIFDIQTVQVKTTSDLISAQLSKETASLANQINASTLQTQGLISTLSERIRVLEQARSEVFGRSSVADPAFADAITRLTDGIAKMKADQSEAWLKLSANIAAVGTREVQSKSERMGQGQVIAWIIGAAMLMAAIATPLIAFLAMRPHL
jgi:hypothetical protein